MTGFTIKNAVQASGILLINSFGCNVIANNATGNYYGIRLDSSKSSMILNNTATRNLIGISLNLSDNNNIVENEVSQNSGKGIVLSYSTGNIIVDNQASDPLLLEYSSVNTVRGNCVNGTETGIELVSTSQNNTVLINTVSFTGTGIFSKDSSNGNIIMNNTIRRNEIGVKLESASANLIYHNTSSIIQHRLSQSIPLVDGITVVNQAENYWSDYAGVDADYDGKGETPYTIDADNVDNYPLTSRHPTAPTPRSLSLIINLGSPATFFITDL